MQSLLKAFAFAISLGLMAGCVEYKTRGFAQADKLTFENWRIMAQASAFTESSGASWDDHTFGVSVVALLDGAPEASEYTVSLAGFSLRTGLCTADVSAPIDLGEIRAKTRPTEVSLYDTGTGGEALIPAEVNHICAFVTAQFSHKVRGEDTVRAYEINLERYENSFYFLPMI